MHETVRFPGQSVLATSLLLSLSGFLRHSAWFPPSSLETMERSWRFSTPLKYEISVWSHVGIGFCRSISMKNESWYLKRCQARGCLSLVNSRLPSLVRDKVGLQLPLQSLIIKPLLLIHLDIVVELGLRSWQLKSWIKKFVLQLIVFLLRNDFLWHLQSLSEQCASGVG